MEPIAIPSYENIFEGDRPSIEDILINIPSIATITICSFINAQLYTSGLYKSENHDAILELLIRNFPEELRIGVAQQFSRFRIQHHGSLIFSMQYCCELIAWEITHYRDREFQDTTPEQHYSVLQALLLVSSILNDRHANALNSIEESADLVFQRAYWPAVSQFEFTNKIGPSIQVCMANMFLKHFAQNEYSQILQDYLTKSGLGNTQEYLSSLIRFIAARQPQANNLYAIMRIRISPELINLANSLTIDISLNSNYQIGSCDYTRLKEKPLAHFRGDQWLVINWNYLNLKVYHGLMFDFYRNSEISNRFNFEDYRSYVAKSISEKMIFQRAVKFLFHNKKHCKVIFDKDDSNSSVDAYVRDNNRIYLIEFKDNIMPSEAIKSHDFNLIKADIDKKFIGNKKPKGVGQTVNVIKQMQKGGVPGDPLGENNIKLRNLQIIPIIVHSWYTYGMPGVNSYLNEIFRERLSEIPNTGTDFKHIYDLVLIDLDTLIGYSLEIREAGLFPIITQYINKIKEGRKNAARTKDQMQMKAHTPFRYAVKWPKASQRIRHKITEILRIFEIEVSAN